MYPSLAGLEFTSPRCFKFLIFLPSPFKFWNYRHTSSHLAINSVGDSNADKYVCLVIVHVRQVLDQPTPSDPIFSCKKYLSVYTCGIHVEVSFFFSLVDPRDQIQVIQFYAKDLYLLSHDQPALLFIFKKLVIGLHMVTYTYNPNSQEGGRRILSSRSAQSRQFQAWA